MIEVQALTKRFGDTVAVDDLSFTVRPGRVTGFLGPNGAGKSTTMRVIVGLDRPNGGTVLVNGRPYAAHPAPLCHVGALLEAKSVHKGRSARTHLLALAQTHGIPAARVDEVLALVGLASVAHRRAGGFSLGMAQRLGIAAALIGDPAAVVLDEPANGLDPDGRPRPVQRGDRPGVRRRRGDCQDPMSAGSSPSSACATGSRWSCSRTRPASSTPARTGPAPPKPTTCCT